MKKIFSTILEELENGGSVVLVELTSSSGSTPRGAGAKMLVFSEESGKSPVGTIGGGKVEYICTKIAQDAINEKRSFINSYDLSQNDVTDIGMICGGNVEACFKFFSHEDAVFIKHVVDLIEKDISSWLITCIEKEKISIGTYDEVNGVVNVEGISTNELTDLLNKKFSFIYKEKKYFIEPIIQKGTVYVFGAGHVSRELVPLIEHLGFKTVVYEERKELLENAYFSNETKIINGEFKSLDKYIKMNERDYAVIMTSGHVADYDVLEQVLRKKLSYVGVIGSRKKIAITKEKLLNAGIEEDRINSFHTPIGIAIKAETPEEIAVSVAAELVLHRAENR